MGQGGWEKLEMNATFWLQCHGKRSRRSEKILN